MPKTLNKNTSIANSPQKKNAAKPLKTYVLLLIITGLVLCLYLPILNYKFTNDDDTALIKDNYTFLSKASNLTSIFKQSVFYNTFKVTDTYYRPILTLSFFHDTQVAGKHYWFFYLTNILLHLACCILVFFFFQKLLYDKTKSFLFAALFAVHPALPQAIAWLPGRNDTLLTLFSLTSFIFLINYCNSKKILHLFFNVLFFAIALLTKETAVFLPVVFCFYLFLWNNDKIKIFKKLNKYKLIILIWLILIIISMVIRKNVLSNTIGNSLSFVVSNFFINLPAIIQYIGKMLLPLHLNTMPVLQDVPLIYGIAVILITTFFVWKTKTKNIKRIFFGALWMLIFLAPSILRTNITFETLFLEHRLYFPIIGFMIIWAETDLIRKFELSKRLSLLIFAAITILFFTTAWIHREDYKDEYHFWNSAVEGSPHSSAALRGLASYYQSNGQTDKAEQAYIHCLKLNPDITEVRNNLGRIYMDKGNDSLAEKLFYEEIKMNPLASVSYYNLGHIRFSKGNYAEAEQMMRKSLSIDPDNAVTENDLAACLAMQKKYEEAIIVCIKILEKYPSYQYPIDYIHKIFTIWDDKEKVAYYKDLLTKKGIAF